jgi:pyruvate/2-oxoglutarate dehydrogenase complex dihydrolipoamide acyltransferase (E2) component
MRRQQQNDYEIIPYPKLRRALAYTLRSAQRTPMIHGLLEIDVTKAREILREQKLKTGEALSFTAFIIGCFARAVEENKTVQACRQGRNHLVVFDDVDVSTPIEREMGGQKQPIVYIIRAANKKTVREIHDEIRAAQRSPVKQAWESLKGFDWMPLVVFKLCWPLVWWVIRRYPRVQKQLGGTVGVTAIGMFGNGGGWGIPIANITQATLGGISQKPGVVDGHIAIRDYLSLTLSFNHNIVDGAPAARFTARLKELIESGYNLTPEQETQSYEVQFSDASR